MTELTKDELLRKYPDPVWHQKFLEICDIRQLLRDCVLGTNYIVPDSFNSAIRLTPAGSEFVQTVVRRTKGSGKGQEVNPKDARLRTFLTLTNTDLLVDVMETDIPAMRTSINDQLKNRRILVPDEFGRTLYDACADEFDEEHPYLTHSESVKVLESVPIGFSQLGRWVTGPFGFVEGAEARWLAPQLELPLFHCDRLTCQRVHFSRFTTDSNAPINRATDVVTQMLEDHLDAMPAWVEFEHELWSPHDTRHSDSATTGLPLLVAECLSDNEITALLAELIDQQPTHLRPIGEQLTKGRIGSTDKFCDGLTRSQCYQMIMLCTDEAIIKSLEILVRGDSKNGERRIEIPEEEVRRPLVNAEVTFGIFELQPELGYLGVRFRPRAEVATLRLHRLIDAMYPDSEDDASGEFDWQFREAHGKTRAERQEELLRTHTPRQVIESMVLSRYVNVLTALETLSIDDRVKDDDRMLVDAILWKLGFPRDAECDENQGFWTQAEKMSTISQTASAGIEINVEQVRGVASNFFTQLERTLEDSLVFATWVLLFDHIRDSSPFAYSPTKGRAWAIGKLNEITLRSSAESGQSMLGDHNSLGVLVESFTTLSKYLEEISLTEDGFRHDTKDLPISPKGSNLRRYPFMHKCVFLDLELGAQKEIIGALKEIRGTLDAAKVAGVRNSWMHYRRESANIQDLVFCLEGTRRAVLRLESLGLCRILYRPRGMHWDPNGRSLTTFEGSRGRRIVIAGPSRLDLSGLPPLMSPQYLVQGALLPGAGDFIRVTLRPESEYLEHWQNFPRRRRAMGAASGFGSPGNNDTASVVSGPTSLA